MKAQFYLSQLKAPHLFYVLNVWGQLLFTFDPIAFQIEHRKRNIKSVIQLRNIEQTKQLIALDGRIICEYNPETTVATHIDGDLVTEINLGDLQVLYHRMRMVAVNS